jgi:hypothetical protein
VFVCLLNDSVGISVLLLVFEFVTYCWLEFSFAANCCYLNFTYFVVVEISLNFLLSEISTFLVLTNG